MFLEGKVEFMLIRCLSSGPFPVLGLGLGWKYGSTFYSSHGTIERKTVSKGCWEQEPHTETEDSHSGRGWGNTNVSPCSLAQ